MRRTYNPKMYKSVAKQHLPNTWNINMVQNATPGKNHWPKILSYTKIQHIWRRPPIWISLKCHFYTPWMDGFLWNLEKISIFSEKRWRSPPCSWILEKIYNSFVVYAFCYNLLLRCTMTQKGSRGQNHHLRKRIWQCKLAWILDKDHIGI